MGLLSWGLFDNVRGCIVTCVVNMNKSSINNRHRLQEICQDLAEVMTVLERHLGGKHNVSFDKKFVASVVGAQVLDLTDGGGEAHGQVQKQIPLIWLRREAGKVAHMMGGSLTPVEDDDKG